MSNAGKKLLLWATALLSIFALITIICYLKNWSYGDVYLRLSAVFDGVRINFIAARMSWEDGRSETERLLFEVIQDKDDPALYGSLVVKVLVRLIAMSVWHVLHEDLEHEILHEFGSAFFGSWPQVGDPPVKLKDN